MISMFIKMVLTLYTILQFKKMVDKEDWKIKQQTVVADLEELIDVHDLGPEG